MDARIPDVGPEIQASGEGPLRVPGQDGGSHGLPSPVPGKAVLSQDDGVLPCRQPQIPVRPGGLRKAAQPLRPAAEVLLLQIAQSTPRRQAVDLSLIHI